ncbi:MAG: tetratricopeptide repeat protein [Bacteroidota bacterium]
MNLDHNIPAEVYEEIERYLLKSMTAEAQQGFVQKLANDPVLREQVQQVRLVIVGIKELSIQDSLEGFHNGIPANTKMPAGKLKRMQAQRWLVAASVIAVLLLGGVWIYTKKSPNEKLFATYFKPDPGLISAMSSTDNYVFDKAMIDYKTGNYEEAINAWEGLLKMDSRNDTLNYFIGAGYLALKNTKAAIPYLQTVTAMPQSFFLKDGWWYLGLALIKEERLKEAFEIINKTEHPQKIQLLQELNKRN